MDVPSGDGKPTPWHFEISSQTIIWRSTNVSQVDQSRSPNMGLEEKKMGVVIIIRVVIIIITVGITVLAMTIVNNHSCSHDNTR